MLARAHAHTFVNNKYRMEEVGEVVPYRPPFAAAVALAEVCRLPEYGSLTCSWWQ